MLSGVSRGLGLCPVVRAAQHLYYMYRTANMSCFERRCDRIVAPVIVSRRPFCGQRKSGQRRNTYLIYALDHICPNLSYSPVATFEFGDGECRSYPCAKRMRFAVIAQRVVEFEQDCGTPTQGFTRTMAKYHGIRRGYSWHMPCAFYWGPINT